MLRRWHQLYVPFNVSNLLESQDVKAKLDACTSDIDKWFLSNRLKLNNKKTEVILFQPPAQKRRNSLPIVTLVDGKEVKPVTNIKSLGVFLDDTLKLTEQVSFMTSCAHFHLRRISAKRSIFSRRITETLVNALVLSRLDYCNSLICGLPNKMIQKLQRVQNAAAKLVMLARKRDHVTPLLRQLHWLPMLYRSQFKILVLVYKIIHGMSPDYLRPLITRYSPTRQLRSSGELLLRRPACPRTKYGERAFCQLSPTLWNCLPLDIRHSDSLPDFKRKLKTHFYTLHYGNV